MMMEQMAQARVIMWPGCLTLLRAYKLSSIDVHAIFPGGPRPSAKVRALVDFLAGELSEKRRQARTGLPPLTEF